MLVARRCRTPVVAIAELQQVQRGEIARGVVEEHVFRARVRRADPAACGAGVPVVHGGVVVQAGIGGRPCGVADLLPQVAGLQASCRSCRRCGAFRFQSPSVSTARRKSSVSDTELFEFWPETVR